MSIEQKSDENVIGYIVETYLEEQLYERVVKYAYDKIWAPWLEYSEVRMLLMKVVNTLKTSFIDDYKMDELNQECNIITYLKKKQMKNVNTFVKKVYSIDKLNPVIFRQMLISLLEYEGY